MNSDKSEDKSENRQDFDSGIADTIDLKMMRLEGLRWSCEIYKSVLERAQKYFENEMTTEQLVKTIPRHDLPIIVKAFELYADYLRATDGASAQGDIMYLYEEQQIIEKAIGRIEKQWPNKINFLERRKSI